jgi:hypothetical protein
MFYCFGEIFRFMEQTRMRAENCSIFIDKKEEISLITANIYQHGSSETMLGEFINTFRSEAVVATKVFRTCTLLVFPQAMIECRLISTK